MWITGCCFQRKKEDKMKRNVLLLGIAMMMVVAGCHNQNAKTTVKDAERAEAALFNEDQTLNAEAVTDAVATFKKYAEENPDAADAADYLFKAAEISINTKQEPQQSIDLVNGLLSGYPQFDKNPVALFMLASFVYDEQLGDLDGARAAYQQIVDQYPDSPFARDAKIAITQLGMTPEELVKMFEAQEQE